MVHTCILCKTRSNKAENVSFHRFPKAENKKKEWLQLLNMDNVSDSTRLCSLHFKSTDYAHVLEGGKQYLKRSAVPSLPDSQKGMKLIVESSVHNEQKTTFETIYIVTKEEESEIKVKTENELSEIKPDNRQDVIADSNHAINSRKLFRSEIDAENEGQLPLKNVRRLGDINIDKVSKSPEESKLCLEVAVDIISELKAKIKSLQTESNELKEKVTDLRPVKRRSKYNKLISDLTDDNSHVENKESLESMQYSLQESLEASSTTLKRPFDESESDEPSLKSTKLDDINIDEVMKSSEESKLYLQIAISTVKELRTKIKYLQNVRNKLKKKMQV